MEDDPEGGAADETVQFCSDGRDYEIDLPVTNAQKLREALRPYATTWRKAGLTHARSTKVRAFKGNPDTT